MGKPKNPFSENDQEHFMQQALLEGRKGLGLTSPNPPVGAVVVNDLGKVMGRGFHARAGAVHAEVNADRRCRCQSRTGCDRRNQSLRNHWSPCSTHGKTPPCCEAIIQAGIKRVFIGTMGPPIPIMPGRRNPYCRKRGSRWSPESSRKTPNT